MPKNIKLKLVIFLLLSLSLVSCNLTTEPENPPLMQFVSYDTADWAVILTGQHTNSIPGYTQQNVTVQWLGWQNINPPLSTPVLYINGTIVDLSPWNFEYSDFVTGSVLLPTNSIVRIVLSIKDETVIDAPLKLVDTIQQFVMPDAFSPTTVTNISWVVAHDSPYQTLEIAWHTQTLHDFKCYFINPGDRNFLLAANSISSLGVHTQYLFNLRQFNCVIKNRVAVYSQSFSSKSY